MPKGNTATIYHIDATAFANIIPSLHYSTYTKNCSCLVVFLLLQFSHVCLVGGFLFINLLLILIIMCMTGLVFFDAPHGILPCPWDVQITVPWLVRIFKQVNAASIAEAWVTAIMHKPLDSHIVHEAMQQAGMSQMTNFFWVKKGHHTQTPVSSLTNVVEMGTVGYKPDRTKVGWKGAGTDPRDRKNVVMAKGVTAFNKADDGDIINPCQKPPEIIQWLGGMHVPPGGNVLVIGFGSGAELCGALDIGLNVVGIESDARQFDAVRRVLVQKYQHDYAILKAVARELGETFTAATSPKLTPAKETKEDFGGSGDEYFSGDDLLEDESCASCFRIISKLDKERYRCAKNCGFVHKACAVEGNGRHYCTVMCKEQHTHDLQNADTQLLLFSQSFE